ncbi:MAG: trypsin-like peptidase domain-containing protein [Anaerolineae bacterium]|nr:trypsin-like peptidase domain-containing protein [Anaerolineae bacterium]
MKRGTLPLFTAIIVSVAATLILTIGAFTAGLLLAPQVSGSARAAALIDSPNVAQPAARLADADTDIVAAYEQVLIDVYKDSLPSMVNIRVTKKTDLSGFHRFNDDPDDLTPPDEPDSDQAPESEAEPELPQEFFNQGGGSGFVWDQEGHIVTNFHVIADATEIEVIFADGTRAEAEVVGSDPDADLAVVKVDLPAEALKPVRLGDSDALQVGQLSIAIGNPFGQDFTMTSGIVSGVGRTIQSGNSPFSIPEIVQTDAPINPGNSGGPLLSRHGEVIGINTQIVSRSGSSSGVGFAVPVNIAKRVIPTLIEGEKYEYAWLGISGGTLTVEAAEFRNLVTGTRGALVIAVAGDGPADRAGLEGRDRSSEFNSDEFRFGGDIITAINDQPITDMNDLITYLVEETRPGDTILLDVIGAEGSPERIEVTLGTRPAANTFNPEDE